MPETRIECSSRIAGVDVYSRGAVVTRTVDLPEELPGAAVSLLLPGITAMAEPGSLRAHVDGERRVSGLRARREVPQAGVGEPNLAARRERERAIRRMEAALASARHRRNMLAGLSPATALPGKKKGDRLEGRLEEILAAAALAEELIAGLDRRIETLTQELERLRAQEQPVDADHSGRTLAGLAGVVEVRLAEGAEHLRGLRISYAVAAARWWPAYTARLSGDGRSAEFSIEAFVAQQTFEDWKDSAISLCTADMARDVRLPELLSLRLGRAQPKRKRGFRPPPEGLDALFRGYDEMASVPPPVVQPAFPARDRLDDMVVAQSACETTSGATQEEFDADEELCADAPMEKERSDKSDPAVRAPSPAPADEAQKQKKRARRSEAPKAALMSRALAGFAASEPAPGGFDGAYGGGAPPAPPEEPEFEPGEDWLDFDGLELAGPDGPGPRGRLHRVRAGTPAEVQQAAGAVERASAPTHARDPRQSRGMFDSRYAARGGVDVSSDGRPHRVALSSFPATVERRFRCVAGEDDRVYREVEIVNPAGAHLLPGPVDVFVDDAFVMTSSTEAVERNGRIRFGLGVEEALRVARNVRADEESKGIFGGTTRIEHSVSIEISSALGGDCEVELIDRIPVSPDDKEIVVELLDSQPEAEAYNQKDRGAEVRGGLRWRVPLKAGGRAEAAFRYAVQLPSDWELAGGNRRE